ncbi:bifunctional phosphoribosylaminoimidazolecarboxamide formyltransferase/IMP cyclohydrolase [Synechococcus sp. RSCCF101]|uniref:bifunctional phosphoribosylaminoimidazolecarboxamide formyltransferase/IMP cyclohydrolase n=1 Tax=Synechococcus sp. RSCCF101 TaxID=2511069 RepID=UPI00124415B9|nr:bifunctional phosphoribosylaminoimidazolecarboxamide formyltransferase/IMP cyclohydrolase [Synechococcus sp. RSCCF101]QEY32284.1 bifunctional phosphoribosylaminoimidazolecarboxamide formyltransferase/IMP cyclohydrolase [Synechococcus sp. RSCCF101]
MAPTALLSVSDKRGIVDFARALSERHGYTLLSSGGTASVLEAAGLAVRRVSEHTGAPEILSGRVKTLHPRVHGGILARRSDPAHQSDLADQAIDPIDMVVVNLYPFIETVRDPAVSLEQAIETIDIGGPAMVRAAAKNHDDVVVLTRPDQYAPVLEALDQDRCDLALRRSLALAAFQHTAAYDRAISGWLAGRIGQAPDQESSVDGPAPAPLVLEVPVRQSLRYGENPHQAATWFGHPDQGWSGSRQLQGKALSANNLLDLDAALATVCEFGYGGDASPAAVVVKHTNPCGVAEAASLPQALERALDADRTSAFGGIVALNREVDPATAGLLTGLFLECVVAPAYSSGALAELAGKPNLRLLEMSTGCLERSETSQLRSILGGVLRQDRDAEPCDPSQWQVVTQRPPSEAERLDLAFAWRLVRHVRSNAIVVAAGQQSLGIGAGQMNRVGSARIALEQAGERAHGAALASDGFFPFDDTVRLAAAAGITAVVQPGGSRRDADSIRACDELGLTMLVTGRRHFLH